MSWFWLSWSADSNTAVLNRNLEWKCGVGRLYMELKTANNLQCSIKTLIVSLSLMSTSTYCCCHFCKIINTTHPCWEIGKVCTCFKMKEGKFCMTCNIIFWVQQNRSLFNDYFTTVFEQKKQYPHTYTLIWLFKSIMSSIYIDCP